MINGDGRAFTARDLTVTLAVAALGYFRWTQLIPMLMGWSFLLIMLGALVLVNFQEQTFSALMYVDDLYGRYVEQEPGTDASVEPSPAVTFDGVDLEGWVWRAWAAAALVGWLLGSLWRQFFGTPEPWRLRRKLLICGALAGACSVALVGIWRLSPEDYHGSAFGWVALFVGVPLGVWLVSAWSLTIAHLIGRFADHIHGADHEGPAAG